MISELKGLLKYFIIELMVRTDKLRDEFSQRLAQACKEAGLDDRGRGAAIAKFLGVSSKAVSKWLNGEAVPRQDKMHDLARFLRVDIIWLQHGDADQHRVINYIGKREPSNKYPLISWISVGSCYETREPHILDDNDEWYESDAQVIGHAFWLKVNGDSMTAPTGLSIPDGTMILVDTGREARNGNLVVATLAGSNEATFKKLIFDAGESYLKSLNPAYPLLKLTPSNKIIGVAIETKMRLI
ncbi:LexA family protein [Symbiopectobacterium sp. RP]|uniref:LexA family protein n=1 Tax=Symbiopectobacterium sp. RP TaxID=3248553 RepID=UPI003D2E3807